MTALLPCPWCQKAPDVHEGGYMGDNSTLAVCRTDDCPNAHHFMRVDEWNRRAPLAVTDDMVRWAWDRIPARPTWSDVRAALEAAIGVKS